MENTTGGQPPMIGDPLPPPPPATEPLTVPGPSTRPKRRTYLLTVALMVAVLAAGLGIGWRLNDGQAASDRSFGIPPAGSAPVPRDGASTGGAGARSVANGVTPAVVNINTYVRTSYGPGAAMQPLGAGTGMILTSSGEVLTNNHVVKGATSITVSIAGHGDYPASVVGADTINDVALIQIQGATGLPVVPIGDPSTLSVGQRLVAIGNALGKGGAPTTTVGAVTALDRTITANDPGGAPEHLHNMIQTDAAIRPGDSGGALVDTSGQVVGMITAGSGNVVGGGSSAVGFAIPLDGALQTVDAIRSGQASSSVIIGAPGFLGVGVQDLNAQTAARAGISASSGALIVRVLPGSPAATANIPTGAAITAIDGHPVSSATSLGDLLHQRKPGDVVQVTWVGPSGASTASVSLVGGGPAA